MASSKYSAVLKKGEDAEKEKIEEGGNGFGKAGDSSKKRDGDTVKLKSKSTKSVAELEMLVESLKRVIEKMKAEND